MSTQRQIRDIERFNVIRPAQCTCVRDILDIGECKSLARIEAELNAAGVWLCERTIKSVLDELISRGEACMDYGQGYRRTYRA